MNGLRTLVIFTLIGLSSSALAAPGGDNAGVGPGPGDTIAGRGNPGFGVGVGSAVGATYAAPEDTRTSGTSLQASDIHQGKTTRTSSVGRKTLDTHTSEGTVNRNSADSQ